MPLFDDVTTDSLSVRKSTNFVSSLNSFRNLPQFSDADLVAFGIAANRFAAPCNYGQGNPSGNAFAVGNINATPIVISRSGILKSVGVDLIGNGGAGSQARVGLYTANPNTGLPENLIPGTDTSLLTMDAGAVTFRSNAINLRVTAPLLLWGAYVCSIGGPAPTIVCSSSALLEDAIAGVCESGFVQAFAFAPLPAVWPQTGNTLTGSLAPMVYIFYA